MARTLTPLLAASVFALAAWIGLVVVPAWTSYSTVWERLAAAFHSLYVLLAGVHPTAKPTDTPAQRPLLSASHLLLPAGDACAAVARAAVAHAAERKCRVAEL